MTTEKLIGARFAMNQIVCVYALQSISENLRNQ